MTIIRDGVTQDAAKVDPEGRLWTLAKASSIQHEVSRQEEDAYQLWGALSFTDAIAPSIYIKNNDPLKNMVITYMRHQLVEATGGTDLPSQNSYFSINLNNGYVSGGVENSAVNMFSGSANAAQITAYGQSPVLDDSGYEIDRWYTKSIGDMNTYNKEGALIIPPNKSMDIKYITDHTLGFIFARISFIMEKIL